MSSIIIWTIIFAALWLAVFVFIYKIVDHQQTIQNELAALEYETKNTLEKE